MIKGGSRGVTGEEGWEVIFSLCVFLVHMRAVLRVDGRIDVFIELHNIPKKGSSGMCNMKEYSKM